MEGSSSDDEVMVEVAPLNPDLEKFEKWLREAKLETFPEEALKDPQFHDWLQGHCSDVVPEDG